jgi:hypothetical protein
VCWMDASAFIPKTARKTNAVRKCKEHVHKNKEHEF